MSNINLLPWREARAQRQKKQFGALLGIFVLATVALGFLPTGWLIARSSPSSSATRGWFRR